MTFEQLTYIFLTQSFVSLFFAIRNETVYRIRAAFIWDDKLRSQDYNALPSYNEMLFSPRYYLLWTKAQWVRYVKAKPK